VRPKAFTILALATALAFVVAITNYAAQTRLSAVRVSGEPLLPGLAMQAAKIANIELRQGEKTITLARDKDTWSLADRGGYPAKPDAVRALLIKLAQAELVEAKTRNKDRYSLLELEDPDGKDAKSRLVRLIDDKGTLIAAAVVGKKRSDAFGANKSGTYVRRPADMQTWLANAEIDVPMVVRDWVQPGIIDIPATKIASLAIAIPGEEPLKIARDAADASKYTLAGMPEGKKLKDATAMGSIVRAAASIELEDVRKLGSAPTGDVNLVTIAADGGLTVALRLRKDGEDYWLSVDATGAEGDAKKTAEEITARTKGWEFKIPAAKAQAILKRRAELFEAS
jgi:Domain of unknown function (DUF4340)